MAQVCKLLQSPIAKTKKAKQKQKIVNRDRWPALFKKFPVNKNGKTFKEKIDCQDTIDNVILAGPHLK